MEKSNPTSPAEELRAAATLIRETASKATPGPWSASAVWSPRSLNTSAVYSYAHPTGTPESEVIPSMRATKKRPLVRPGDAKWIALMSPAVAEYLFRWLADAANDMAGAMVVGSKLLDAADPVEYCDEPDSVRAALAFARSIRAAAGYEQSGGDRG